MLAKLLNYSKANRKCVEGAEQKGKETVHLDKNKWKNIALPIAIAHMMPGIWESKKVESCDLHFNECALKIG